jgi:acetyltransferase-like isoleucine patch superfamily enzyme
MSEVSLPKHGAKQALGWIYTKLRGRELAPEVPTTVLLGFATRKACEAIRGVFLGLLYHRGKLHFRGRHVRVTCPSYLQIGRGVAFGDNVLVEAFSNHGIRLGEAVTVARGASLCASGVIAEPGEGISIGANTAIGMHNTVWGQGGVTIGNNTLLGPNVLIVSEDHGFVGGGVLIRDQSTTRAPVKIGNDCWLGAGVVVVAGVTVGDGCVVGAGAVVTRSLPSGSVAVGVPAHVIASRY